MGRTKRRKGKTKKKKEKAARERVRKSDKSRANVAWQKKHVDRKESMFSWLAICSLLFHPLGPIMILGLTIAIAKTRTRTCRY